MSNISRQRILNVMGTFRPAFRTVAQSLTDIDLVLVEEAFERLLLVSFFSVGGSISFLFVFIGLPLWDFILLEIVICAAHPFYPTKPTHRHTISSECNLVKYLHKTTLTFL